MNINKSSRRDFLATSAGTAATLGLAGNLLAEASPLNASPLLNGKAEHVISIWLGGGMGQCDTFDPKRKGDPKAKKAGSYY